MTTLTAENVQWLLEEVASASVTKPAPEIVLPRLYHSGTMTETAIAIAVALRYEIKGGEA